MPDREAMPDRELVSEQELMRVLNEALAGYPECAGSGFAGALQRLAAPEADGCNWSRSMTVRGRPVDAHRCGELAADVVSEISARYNLA